jgi:pimeloyl-ACP methyl ester carboxylesterase
MATPGISRFAQAGPGKKMLADGVVDSSKRKEVWKNGVLETFLDQFEDPKRSHASMYIYRSFLVKELPQIQLGKYVPGRLTTHTKLLFGLDDVAIDQAVLDADHSKFADDFEIERVSDCGHFIVDERPELVIEKALEFFA